MNRPLLIGATAGVVVGIAVTLAAPLLAPISLLFFWLADPGVAAVLVIKDEAITPSGPVLIANAMVYGLVGFLVGLVVGGIRRRRTVRRQRRGLCVNCGYNLTGNISGVCPECGTDIEQRASRSESEP